MSWEETAYATLTGDAALTALVDDRISLDSPIRKGYPHVLLRVIDGTPTPTLCGDSNLFGILVEVNSFAKTRRIASRAYNAARKALTAVNTESFSAVTESYAGIFHDLDESRFRAVGTMRIWTNDIEDS